MSTVSNNLAYYCSIKYVQLSARLVNSNSDLKPADGRWHNRCRSDSVTSKCFSESPRPSSTATLPTCHYHSHWHSYEGVYCHYYLNKKGKTVYEYVIFVCVPMS